MNQKPLNKTSLSIALLSALSSLASPSMASELGKATLDLRLRYENVEQDNALKDADALTLRTRLNYQTIDYNGLSAVIEFEDSRSVLGVDDYNDTNGMNPEYSVIADPEHTELDQGYVQYKNDGLTLKVGRQLLTHDGHRFVGHVAWRQDRQTFDAVTVQYQVTKDLTLNYSYIDKRNRIFADLKDVDSKDHLFNAAYKTALGTLTGYAYLLEVDNNTDNSLDTFGFSFKGSQKVSANKYLYAFEFASQTFETANTEFDANYMLLEAGVVVSGITAKVGYESLGSDNAQYGFSTPLATLHKFQGWTDQFLATPNTGVEDIYLSLAGKAWDGKWTVAYHDFSADDATATVDDLGNELGMVFTKGFGKYYSAGIKYATYSAGDSAAGKVDTDKFWLWLGAKF